MTTKEAVAHLVSSGLGPRHVAAIFGIHRNSVQYIVRAVEAARALSLAGFHHAAELRMHVKIQPRELIDKCSGCGRQIDVLRPCPVCVARRRSGKSCYAKV